MKIRRIFWKNQEKILCAKCIIENASQSVSFPVYLGKCLEFQEKML
jgi:hypothetical protein